MKRKKLKSEMKLLLVFFCLLCISGNVFSVHVACDNEMGCLGHCACAGEMILPGYDECGFFCYQGHFLFWPIMFDCAFEACRPPAGM